MNKHTIIKDALNKDDLKEIFREAGIKPGMTVEVHSSLRGLGYIVGYAQTVVDALLETVGYEGAVVMPLQAGSNSEPSSWRNPPADPSIWNKIRDSIPAFDPIESDAEEMGMVVDNFRRRQGVYYTRHPSCAFAAYGKYAKLICSHQNLHYPLNDQSPIGKMRELRAQVLLIGVDYDNCTGMHLGEYQSRTRPIVVCGGALDRGNGREWVKYLDIALDSKAFEEAGKRLEEDEKVKVLQVNQSTIKCFRLNDGIRYTREYLIEKYK